MEDFGIDLRLVYRDNPVLLNELLVRESKVLRFSVKETYSEVFWPSPGSKHPEDSYYYCEVVILLNYFFPWIISHLIAGVRGLLGC